MKPSYQIVDRKDSQGFARYLAQNGQLLLPLEDVEPEAHACSNKKNLPISGRAYSHGSPSWIFSMLVCFPKKALLVYNRHRLLVQEAEMHNLTRITFNPEVMGGKPCIRGMRVTVGTIVGLVASGKTVDDVLADYPYLEREDILEALSYAAWRAEEREVPLAL
jgi:uncharacterized protein (DUF433 family)